MPFEADFLYDYEGLKKASRARLLTQIKEYWYLFIIVYLLFPLTWIVEGITKNNTSLIIQGAAFPIFFIVFFMIMHNISLRRQIRTNKAIGNLNMHYTFFENGFEYKNSVTSARCAYDAIYKIVEDKNYFFIKPSARQMMIVPKGSCSPELMNFLQSKKLEINARRKKR